MTTNKENTSEEIDLGQLFKLIGNTFNKFFKLISSIFNKIFHYLILSLLFVRKHFLKFTVAGCIGLGIGWYLDINMDPVYRSSMVVEPNFNSTQQLYNNVSYYNELAEQEADSTLAEAFEISINQAATITQITIESYTDENQKLKQFSDFVKSLDSTSRNIVEYKNYLENFNNINAKFHKINMEATDPVVAKKCQKAIVQSISDNDYFKSQMNTNTLNLRINDSIYRKQLVEIDSLKSFYQKLKLLEVQKSGEGTSGTNINLSSEKQLFDNSEITLLNETKSISQDILELNKQKANTENIINIISDFPNKGALINGFFNQKKFVLPIMFIMLTLFSLIFISLNRYLKNYNE